MKATKVIEKQGVHVATYTTWQWRVMRETKSGTINCDPRWKKYSNFLADMGERPCGSVFRRTDRSKRRFCKDNFHWSRTLGKKGVGLMLHGHIKLAVSPDGRPVCRFSRTYSTWLSLKRTGQRGHEWRAFTFFLKDMGIRPEGARLRRYDVGVNFCKANCYWETT